MSCESRVKQRNRMNKLVVQSVTKLISSNYIKPYRLNFTQEGHARKWDLVQVHDAVSVVLYNKSKDELVMVRQFRPAVYLHDVYINEGLKSYSELESFTNWEKYPFHTAITTELCAGIVDKELPVEQIAKAEILEECGFVVPVENIQKITATRQVGTGGIISHLFYCEIEDKMKVTEGGGAIEEHEIIEVVNMSPSEVKSILYDEFVPKPAGFLCGMQWFFANKYNNK